MRIDDATHVLGLRINEWVSAIVCLGAVAFVVTGLRKPVEVSEVDAADHRRGGSTAST
jgi:hypothetical protein